MYFNDYTEEDQKLHDFVITHNRKLKNIKTIVNNIMWTLNALCDEFDGFEFITIDENVLHNIVSSYGFTEDCNNLINILFERVKLQTRSAHKYDALQPIAHKSNLLPDDIPAGYE